MKIKIPDLLRMAIEQNDMSLVIKAYQAITGEQIQIPTDNIQKDNKPKNLFYDDGTLAKKDSPKHNTDIQKLYGEPTQRRDQSVQYELKCSCGSTELVGESVAAYFSSGDSQFLCQKCILRSRRQ